ncbi:hypothetical protein BJF83_22740 [Nocardiopsis sp. CNR-923]|nr:hypothetical protein BJF83_22740 [Nocardiopsis sp. CNR-923]
MLTQHLYRYLQFTTQLEQLVVNKTMLDIAYGRIGVDLPRGMVFDAHKIYCDEAYHALFSMDMYRQVIDATGVAPRIGSEPHFFRRLRRLLEDVDPSMRLLVELLFVFCSETLISGTLDSGRDQQVDPAVHEMVKDHAKDEGKHHAYFASFLFHLWPQIHAKYQESAAALIPDLIMTFLEPDRESLVGELCGYDLSRNEAEQVVAETFTGDVVSEYARATARHTLRYCREAGVLDHPAAVERFHELGLIEEDQCPASMQSAPQKDRTWKGSGRF